MNVRNAQEFVSTFADVVSRENDVTSPEIFRRCIHKKP